MSGYIGTQPVPQATQTRDSFTATSGQTSFSTGGYTPNFLDVYLNGVKLASADYTATNGSDVVLASGASTGDILEVVAYTAFDTANVTGATNFTVTGAFTSQGIDDNGNATALTIDASENVLVGLTATEAVGTNAGTQLRADGLVYAAVTSDAHILSRRSSDGAILNFRKDTTTVGGIGVSPDGPAFGTSSQQVAFHVNKLFPCQSYGSALDNTIDLGYSGSRFKDLYLSGGVHLGGTGSANKLDDYEEGTFTPFMRINNGVEGITFNGREGSYTKIGNLVTVMIYMALSSKGTNVGNVTIDGLPFTAGNQLGAQTSFNGTCLPAYFTSMATNISTLSGWVGQGTTEMYLRHTDGSGNSSTQNTGNGNLNNNSDFRFFITYMAT